MSWLNLNDSLNSIKGQLSNFASGVLADGIVNDTDPFTELSSANQKIQELQNLCASQDVEIASLRRQNAEFYEKISFKEKTNSVHENNVGANGENWFWDPPTSDTNDPKIDQTAQRKNSTNSSISELNKRILNLENEKKDLIISLDQLDLDCQNTTDKLVTLKDNLQTDYNVLKNDFDIAKSRIESLETQNLQYKSDLSNKLPEIDHSKHLNSKLNQTNLKKELDLASTQIASLETQNSELHSNLNASLKEIENLKCLNLKQNQVDLKTELQLARTHISTLETQNSELHSNLNSSLKEIEILKVNSQNLDTYNDLKIKFETLEHEKNNLETYLNDAKLEIENLKALNVELSSKNVDSAENSVPKSKFESLLDEKNNLESKFNQNKTQFNNLKIEFNNLNSNLKSNEFELKCAELELKNVESLEKIKELSNDLKENKHNFEVANSEFELKCKELLNRIEELKIENTELNLNKNNFEQYYSKAEHKNVEALDKIKDLEVKIKELKLNKQSNFSDDHKNLQDKFDELSSKYNDLYSEKQEMHKKYVNILTENVKKYVDYEIPDEFIQKRENPDLSEFNSKVETVLKLLLDFKWKTETLEKKLCEISHEKAVAVSEKNHEIEKLLNNSEILSQEVIRKTQTINHYEIECSELIKNNDLLIAELNQYKNNNGLQTISETNEDNLLQLENQLENSNKRIRGLELLINDMENAKQDVALETQTELDYIKKQLNMTGKELSQSKKEYHELLNMFKQLEFEKQNLNSQLTQNKTQFDDLNQEKTRLESAIDKLKSEMEHSEYKFTEANFDLEAINEELSSTKVCNVDLQESNIKLETSLNDLKQQLSDLQTSNINSDEMVMKIQQLETEISNLNTSKAELVSLVTVKHQESLQYHAEIQRLNQVLFEAPKEVETFAQNSELEKLRDQNNFLKEKCEKLTQNLLDEQSNTQKVITERNSIAEKEQSLVKELERLRIHLVEIEDTYTQELLLAEQKNQEMLTKMTEIEQRERDSSTIYTSVSIRANQQVETLQNQLQLVTVQRDEFQKKNSEAEDTNHKQIAALTNLQCVLEQFQRDRQSDIINETERIRRQINVEKLKQNDLLEEISSLKAQLEESKQGLKAAARLTEQMEKSKLQVVTMKNEVTKLQEQLAQTEEKYKALFNQTDAKVDKTLVRNLIIGFISSNNHINKDQTQILKIISTVLDFSQQDSDKLNLQKPNSWLGAILHPMAGANISQQSLSEAFVRFLENESQPKQNQPPLMNVRKMSTESNASTSSNKRDTPVLSEVVLPTFADFAQNRNSSSILKDVLKEN